ncbi:sialidase family protein [Aquisphaera insulae]|uniref:sialidase family protein n=1 Tax=Aquisphaera insulae TaxID=2712864 RepID=UPI0013ECA260|nr:sialidase family protein [Aquisphaera insulae]
MNIHDSTHRFATLTRRQALALLGMGSVAITRGSAAAEGRAGGLKLLDIRKIWSGGGHNAFTGLVRHRDRWFCVFRESTGHIPGTDGVIRVLTSDDGRGWSTAAVVAEEGVDLRDPKIDVIPDGRLMILMGGSYYKGRNGQPNRTFDHARSRASFSADGRTWSPPAPVSLEGQWLWRVTWNEKAGYGFAYRVDEAAKTSDITLWKTTDGLAYERVADPKLPTGVRPDETTIRFRPDGSMVALVRNDAKPAHAHIGTSRPPFTAWTWSDGGHHVGGPDFLIFPDGRMIYAGRDYPDGPRTVVGVMTPDRLTPELTLPSGGDTSYPGLVWHDGRLWISYYASHEGKASVYLAEVEVTR